MAPGVLSRWANLNFDRLGIPHGIPTELPLLPCDACRAGLRGDMIRKIIAIAAWACLLFIIYATLTSINARPELARDESAVTVVIERCGAYALLGLLFCLAYRNHIAWVGALVFGTAVTLEFLQLLVPGRDARLIDAIEKLAGGGAGILSAIVLLAWIGRDQIKFKRPST
jgi:VanZ family protein